MALALMRYSINGQHGNGGIINTNNIEKLVKLGDVIEPKFKGFLVSGEILIFNQFYYNVSFITVHTLEQLYILLAKLDSGKIKDGGET